MTDKRLKIRKRITFDGKPIVMGVGIHESRRDRSVHQVDRLLRFRFDMFCNLDDPASLTEHDQTELLAQAQAVKEGAQAVPYHADGELCRMYPAAEFSALAQAATAHVFYHRTYCNHVNAWIARAGLDELAAIEYGAELPADLAASMAQIIQEAGGAE